MLLYHLQSTKVRIQPKTICKKSSNSLLSLSNGANGRRGITYHLKFSGCLAHEQTFGIMVNDIVAAEIAYVV